MSHSPFRTPASEAHAGLHYDGAAAALDFLELNGAPASAAPSLVGRAVTAALTVRLPVKSSLAA